MSRRDDHDTFVVGVDFGTLSGRALVVRTRDGEEVGTAVHEYGHGVIDRDLSGSALPPDWALQHPQDYLDVLLNAVPKAIAAAGISADDVVGIGTDFTACTVLPALADGTPLCFEERFSRRPHAYPKLWKHHSAQPQADRITALAAERGEPWLARYGGRISSEWEYAKALQVLEEDPEVYRETARWIEAADWIVWQLCGAETRNTCTAGYKGIFQDGRYPSREYLAALNPAFADFVDEKLAHPLLPLGGRAGSLVPSLAASMGLRTGIAIAIGNVDAHVTAPAAQATAPGQLVAVMGTSTCHVVNGIEAREVPGMCGAVNGGIVDGLWGFEAGQSGVGDIFGWFVEQQCPAAYREIAAAQGVDVHDYLSELASEEPAGAHGLLALDWHNGNRSVLVDHELSGIIVGLTLATRPEQIYRALIESTAFGSRLIVEAFERGGVPITEFVAAGGLIRNERVMQIYADVLDRPLSVIGTDQGPALGAALHAAVAAGVYADIAAAAAAMGKVRRAVYRPDERAARVYDEIYKEYVQLHDYFGRGANDVMHRLRAIRRMAVLS